MVEINCSKGSISNYDLTNPLHVFYKTICIRESKHFRHLTSSLADTKLNILSIMPWNVSESSKKLRNPALNVDAQLEKNCIETRKVFTTCENEIESTVSKICTQKIEK